MMKPYPAYKESGVEWLGEIPEHWNLTKLKWLSTKIGSGVTPRGGAEIYQETGIPLIRSQNVHFAGLRLDDVVFISDEIYESMSRSAIQSNDVLINITGASIGRCALVPEPFQKANVNQHVCIVRSEDSRLSKYLHLFLCYEIGQTQVMNSQNGAAREGLNYEQLGNFVITLPPPTEQEAIADYLDRKTAVIDTLIAKKERQIELLQEQRTAVINTAVTKGLNPHAPLKYSGISWLGQIPAHWEVKKLSFFAKIGNGSTPNRGNADYWNDGHIPWLNSSVVNQGIVLEAEQFVTPLAVKECHLPIVEKNSVLVGITGQGKTRGTSTLLAFESTINQHMAYITPHSDHLDCNYLNILLSSMYAYLRFISDDQGGTKGALTCDDIKQLRIPFPPIDEQKKIALYLEQKEQKTNKLISYLDDEITKWKEYRTAVISAAVTGKIDVREAVTHQEIQG